MKKCAVYLVLLTLILATSGLISTGILLGTSVDTVTEPTFAEVVKQGESWFSQDVAVDPNAIADVGDYTGTGKASQTVKHELSQVPDYVIVYTIGDGPLVNPVFLVQDDGVWYMKQIGTDTVWSPVKVTINKNAFETVAGLNQLGTTYIFITGCVNK